MADVVGAVGGALGGALAFVLSYFYARTMRVIEGLPEKYMPRADCVQARTDCRHDRDIGREEVLGRKRWTGYRRRCFATPAHLRPNPPRPPLILGGRRK